jgi:tRNA threonylcarbamoyladenosine biosynthesis protein TsaE
LTSKLLTYKTESEAETFNLGRLLGKMLTKGNVIALAGELGGGKTCFTKGLAAGIGLPPDIVITSPSFSLANEYDGPCPLFHMDAYRMASFDDFLSAGLDEYFYRDGVVVIEWADKWPDLLSRADIKVDFVIIDEHRRMITFLADHQKGISILNRYEKLLKRYLSHSKTTGSWIEGIN